MATTVLGQAKPKASSTVARQLVAPTIAQLPGQQISDPFSTGGDATTGQGIDESTGGAPTSGEKQASSNQQPAVTQANQMAQAPYFQPSAPSQPVAQFPPAPSGGGAMGVANQLLGQLSASAQPNPQVTAGMKEQAKTGYLDKLRQANEQIAQSAASRGVGGNFVQGQMAANTAQAPLDITNIFRGVDQSREQEGLQRLLAALSGATNLGGLELQGELGRGNLGVAQQNANTSANSVSGNLALGNRSQDLQEANSLWDKNNILPMLAAILGPSFSWG